MKLDFARLMQKAGDLTRAGSLREATAAIQAALRGRSDGHTARAGATPAADGSEADIVDIDARVVDAPGIAPADGVVPTSEGQFLVGSHTGKHGTREYKLFVPALAAGRTAPLVVMLHGCTQDPDDFAAGTRMNEAARERGLFVLYPAQTQSANPARCWNWFKHNHQARDRGEPALLADMTREVIARHAVDPRRVYVAGLSAGGAMAAILGEAYPDVFAAVAVHSGLPVGAATDVTSAMAAMKRGATPRGAAVARPPVIVFHGDQDSTVHPVNGEHVAKAHGPKDAPQVDRRSGQGGRDHTQHVYRDEAGRIVSEHWVLHGTGHAWSGGSPQGSYTDPAGADATKEMLRFFEAVDTPMGA